MELQSLTCPKCGSALEIENGLDTFYCKYCGTKIQAVGQSGEAYQARIRVKELDHEMTLREKEIELEMMKMKQIKKDHRRKFISNLAHNDLAVAFLFMAFGVLSLLFLVLLDAVGII